MNRKLALIATAVLVTGCSNVKMVSTEEANQVISAIQAPGAPQVPQTDEWIQPRNKKEDCKTLLQRSSTENPNAKTTWDGACKDGYAYGLGREFVVGDNDTGSLVATYTGARTKPTYHSVSSYTLELFAYGDPVHGTSIVGKSGNIATGEDYLQVVGVQSAGGNFSSKFSVAKGEMVYEKEFPSGYSVLFTTPSNPASAVTSTIAIKKNNLFYYFGIVKYQNGAIEHKKVEGGGFVPAKLPNNYLAFINTVANEINDQLKGAERYADESYKKVMIFKNRFCITPVQPAEPAHYRDICGGQGDLTNAYSKITAMIASREARFSQIKNNQRQTAIQAAQIQAINNQTEAINNQALSKSLNDLNNSLRQQTNSLYQNSYQAPTIPSYGQQPTYDTTCYNLGVVVRCNTR